MEKCQPAWNPSKPLSPSSAGPASLPPGGLTGWPGALTMEPSSWASPARPFRAWDTRDSPDARPAPWFHLPRERGVATEMVPGPVRELFPQGCARGPRPHLCVFGAAIAHTLAPGPGSMAQVWPGSRGLLGKRTSHQHSPARPVPAQECGAGFCLRCFGPYPMTSRNNSRRCCGRPGRGALIRLETEERMEGQ